MGLRRRTRSQRSRLGSPTLGSACIAESLSDAVVVTLASPPEVLGALSPALERKALHFIEANRNMLARAHGHPADDRPARASLTAAAVEEKTHTRGSNGERRLGNGGAPGLEICRCTGKAVKPVD